MCPNDTKYDDIRAEAELKGSGAPTLRGGDGDTDAKAQKAIKRERRAAKFSLAGWKVAFVLLIVVVALAVIIAVIRNKDSLAVPSAGETELDGGILYTEAEFQQAVLLGARERAQLVVYEREVSVESTLKRTFADWAIFTKTKTMRSYGTGSYAVDLASLSREDITVDVVNYTVTVRIPHASLYTVTPDYTKTEFEDTERGLLAFGEIKLTSQQQNELEKQVLAEMTEALSAPEELKKADDEALERCETLFSPLVAGVSGDFDAEIVFDE